MAERTPAAIAQAQGVGYIPSGLFIVTTHENGVSDGYLASWVQQVSFEPLMVALAINPGRPGYEHIKAGKTFTINVVGDHETQFLRHFWKGYGPENNPFGEISHEVSEHGGLILKDAKAAIDCQLVESTKPGDHEIIMARVIGSKVLTEEGKPKTHVRKSGLDY